VSRDHYKFKIISDVLNYLKSSRPNSYSNDLENFSESFLKSAPTDDIKNRSFFEIGEMIFNQWKLMQNRNPGAAIISVFNPREKNQRWDTPYTAIVLINDDMPFLVDSATALLVEKGYSVHLVVHPIFSIRRAEDGNLIDISKPEINSNSHKESCILFEVDNISSENERQKLKLELENVFEEVRCAVSDWHPMLKQLNTALSELSLPVDHANANLFSETAEFLAWMHDSNFTFLGYREYAFESLNNSKEIFKPLAETGLGKLRNSAINPLETEGAERSIFSKSCDYESYLDYVAITKSDLKSLVHRPVLMDCITVAKVDSEGKVIGERRFLGLFTSTAYSCSVNDIPILRKKVENVLGESGLQPGAHDYKALEHVLETLPRDELFQSKNIELKSMAHGVLVAEERQRPSLFIRRDSFERFISCLVYIPRDYYNTDLRKRIQWILEAALGGKVNNYSTLLSSSPLARVHYIIKTNSNINQSSEVEDIETAIMEALRSWTEKLREALERVYSDDKVPALLSKYCDAFSTAYREDFSADVAAKDIVFLEEAQFGADLSLHLYRNLENDESEINLKIYHPEKPIPLSDILPKLERMGLRVISERPYKIKISEKIINESQINFWVHDLLLVDESRSDVDLKSIRNAFEESLKHIWSGITEDDGFNYLIVKSGMSWRSIVIFRAIAKYLRQIGAPFSQEYMEKTLCKHSNITALLYSYFVNRFDPTKEDNRGEKSKRNREIIIENLESVLSLDEDRIIRRFLNIIDSMLRTNYFQSSPNGFPKPYLSFKLDSSCLDELPLPRPHVEVFVYSPRFEGIHLRGGKIARGGIRWSDRREDFRTEILGLMKAQMVKNALIIPVGAKGGFVIKKVKSEDGKENFSREGRDCYSMFISGLLDLTDNFFDGTLLEPSSVIKYDDIDSYLVVAADKGTAKFSDLANEISGSYEFWLGDAFASGGKDGYDHKKMGITARGAWESVKRHFRELEKNIEVKDFTVIGVGDMSGDVFGNGMLQSRHTKLIGAFNHSHIFLDPNPDPELSYQERERLFKMPSSEWSDYDQDILSKGGLIAERSAKSIELTKQIQDQFCIDETYITPNTLIRKMLTAPTDLLWFGGIGCYIKAKAESNSDIGDRGNDSLRINASDLRCKIIAEGANLGVTQKARVEFALLGGKINTDAIDNSAGVDCSDHEVNIKVLLNQFIANGKLTTVMRNRLLGSMTENVSELVIKNNYLQSQALSLELESSKERTNSYIRLMRELESVGQLNRDVECLPSDDLLLERIQNGKGLTRPELAVLLALSKINVFTELIDSDIADDKYFSKDLERYFPEAILNSGFSPSHEFILSREIIATSVSNSIINRAGCTFINEIRKVSNMPVCEIARAYSAARHVFSLQEIWSEIEGLDNHIDASVQMTMLKEVAKLTERGTLWFLYTQEKPLDVSKIISNFAEGVASFGEEIETSITQEILQSIIEKRNRFMEIGVPEGIARIVSSIDPLLSACDIVEISRISKISVTESSKLYFLIGSKFKISWLRNAADDLGVGDQWQNRAINAITDDLYLQQRLLCLSILSEKKSDVSIDESIKSWCSRNTDAVERSFKTLEDLQAADIIDLAMLTVANGHIRSLIDKSKIDG
tara:strand:- start:62763 stop:67628 length:4866 start_codon:yes stop_codon:yes gene_type:complete